MIKSMTAYAQQEKDAPPFGRVRIEMRSSNHKYLEIVFRLPDGFMALEDKLKKTIESKISRGRIVCNIYVTGAFANRVTINKKLARRYVDAARDMKNEFHIQDALGLNTLMQLPGIVLLSGKDIEPSKIWPVLSGIQEKALGKLLMGKQKEGRALSTYLKYRARTISNTLFKIEGRFKNITQLRVRKLTTADERSGFLKESDISEELQRLKFHVKNFIHKLAIPGPVGKELDFIAQEMQREANTIGAKSFDSIITAKVVYIKSQIEKIREQVQNVE